MNPVRNPYTPNAGAQPPAVLGRDVQLTTFDLLLRRMAAGRTEQSMIITGLRAVGKTVLLGQFRTKAYELGRVVVEREPSKHGVLKSFSLSVDPSGTLTGGMDVDAARGSADQHELQSDLSDLFVAVGEAAKDSGRGIVLLFDEDSPAQSARHVRSASRSR